MATKTIFITGGIVSGLGKGITAASLGALLKARGFSVMPMKLDMYLNVDAGTLNPFEHGEVFVTEDGAETDLDLGHYERFIDVNISKLCYGTMGGVYQTLTEEERKGTFLGKTIQIVPHVTDEIQRRFQVVADELKPDFQIVEMGGVVGHLEEQFALEAQRQYMVKHRGDCIAIHVVKMDYLYPSDEGKTKPIQHAVSLLRGYGISPDILIVRAKRAITTEERAKIAMFCGVTEEQIIVAMDAESLYDIPFNMEQEGLAKVTLRLLGVKQTKPNLALIKEVAKRSKITQPVIRVGLIGKYLNLLDSYLSVLEAVKHAGFANKVKTEIVPIDSEHLKLADLEGLDAIIVPGGFGTRGVEGKIKAIQYARENKIPYLGICLGLQTAVIEAARNLAGLKDATSEEFDENATTPVIAFLPDQKGLTRKGGTMRLGSYEAVMSDSLVARLYSWWGDTEAFDFPALEAISKLDPVTKTVERHRHRYEVNPEYHKKLQETGLVFSGMSPDGTLVEFIEYPRDVHPYFVATQAHPEFKSRPYKAHPLFAGLIAAAKEQQLSPVEVAQIRSPLVQVIAS